MAKAKFGGMTKAEQRIAICKDALAWLKAGALIAAHDGYVWPTRADRQAGGPGGVLDSLNPRSELRNTDLGPCRVCAIGAIFLAKAVRFDSVKAAALQAGDLSALLDHFDEPQLAMIEAAYEGTRAVGQFCTGEEEYVAAESFGFAYINTPHLTLTAILQNVIDNGGTFKP